MLSEIQTMTRQFNSDMDDFVLTLDDLVKMDCAQDPEGFAAALEEAKIQLNALNIVSVNIKTKLSEARRLLLEAKMELEV